ncbi:MAG TPA: AEC family transporter, partial [Methanomicrobiales archaeon]|nr:AEC family transporter [Methanomicrobiales archaeon]
LFLGSITIPSPVLDFLDLLGSVTTPLAMIVIGIILAGFPLREMFLGWKVYLVSGIRLLIIPLLLWLVLDFVFPNSLVNSVVIILAAMPVATNCAILAGEYEANPYLASKVIFISTLGSVVTIPIIATLLL